MMWPMLMMLILIGVGRCR